MELQLLGRRALITGGSKGIGRAVADEFASEGVDIAICARTENELQSAAAQLRIHGRQVHAYVADISDPLQVNTLVRNAADALGGLDILVNNAGSAHPGNFSSLTDEAWQTDLNVKLFSHIRCIRSALPYLRKSAAPRVININSVYARSPNPHFFATTVNRAACLNLSKALAQELGSAAILVNSVNIGFVMTPQWRKIKARRDPGATDDKFFAGLTDRDVPLGRFGRADEVSGIVAFLASARATYITGASIDVAGGMGGYV